jgi:hypothetical protein
MDEADPRSEFREVWVFEEIVPSRLDKIGLELIESGGFVSAPCRVPVKKFRDRFTDHNR